MAQICWYIGSTQNTINTISTSKNKVLNSWLAKKKVHRRKRCGKKQVISLTKKFSKMNARFVITFASHK